MSAHLPVQLVRRLQLRYIECATLPDKLEVARTSRGVVKGDQHHVREVHARELDLEHTCRGLDLCLQTMRRAAEHHHRARELADELLALDDLGNVASDLHGAGELLQRARSSGDRHARRSQPSSAAASVPSSPGAAPSPSS